MKLAEAGRHLNGVLTRFTVRKEGSKYPIDGIKGEVILFPAIDKPSQDLINSNNRRMRREGAPKEKPLFRINPSDPNKGLYSPTEEDKQAVGKPHREGKLTEAAKRFALAGGAGLAGELLMTACAPQGAPIPDSTPGIVIPKTPYAETQTTISTTSNPVPTETATSFIPREVKSIPTAEGLKRPESNITFGKGDLFLLPDSYSALAEIDPSTVKFVRAISLISPLNDEGEHSYVQVEVDINGERSELFTPNDQRFSKELLKDLKEAEIWKLHSYLEKNENLKSGNTASGPLEFENQEKDLKTSSLHEIKAKGPIRIQAILDVKGEEGGLVVKAKGGKEEQNYEFLFNPASQKLTINLKDQSARTLLSVEKQSNGKVDIKLDENGISFMDTESKVVDTLPSLFSEKLSNIRGIQLEARNAKVGAMGSISVKCDAKRPEEVETDITLRNVRVYSAPDSSDKGVEVSEMNVKGFSGKVRDNYLKVRVRENGKTVEQYILANNPDLKGEIPPGLKELGDYDVPWIEKSLITQALVYNNPKTSWGVSEIKEIGTIMPHEFLRMGVKIATEGDNGGIEFVGKNGEMLSFYINSKSQMSLSLKAEKYDGETKYNVGFVDQGKFWLQLQGRELMIFSTITGKLFKTAYFPEKSGKGPFLDGMTAQFTVNGGSKITLSELSKHQPSNGELYVEPATPIPVSPTAESKPTQKPQPTSPARPTQVPAQQPTPKAEPIATQVPKPEPTATATPKPKDPEVITGPEIKLGKYTIYNMDVSRFRAEINDIGFKTPDGKYCPGAANTPGCSVPGLNSYYGMKAANGQFLVETIDKYSEGPRNIYVWSTLAKYPHVNDAQIKSATYYYYESGNEVFIAFPDNFQYQGNSKDHALFALNNMAIGRSLNGGKSNNEIMSIGAPGKVILVSTK